MERKSQMDTFGATALVLFAVTLAFNQIVIKVTNGGFSPVFVVAIRSVIAGLAVAAWMAWRKKPFEYSRPIALSGLIVGLLFSFEFICLYISLDLTDVSRASVIFYSMPVWLALAAHFALPGERLSATRLLGLALGLFGVGVALMDRTSEAASLWGDLLALVAAMGWAAIALIVRVTPLAKANPETQLMWQLLVSAIVLSFVAPLFGDLIREPEAIHFAGLLFQSIGVVAIGYLMWFWLLTIYPASSVASFSFLSPVFSVLFGWWLLGEQVGSNIWIALGLVTVGVVLINRKA